MIPFHRIPAIHKYALLALALLVAPVLAQGSPAEPAEPVGESGPVGEHRLITIDSSGGTQSGNLRFGPLRYQHPDPQGIVATVSTLTIRGAQAVLSAPDETLIAQAQGQREVLFDGGVVVSRGRLTATGSQLHYAEATGLGVLEGDARIVIAPASDGEREVVITAQRITFDVDTDTSVSEGAVELVNGNQTASADRLEYEEGVGLGMLSGSSRPEVTRAADDGGLLRIEADEIRVLTDLGALYARGDVVVEDGDIVSRGDLVFYDDEEEVAEIIGDPVLAEDRSAGIRLETARVRQDVRFRVIEAMDASLPTPYTADQFQLAREADGD